MPSWNVKLKIPREQVIRVSNIIYTKPEFMIVQLSNGKQQKLSDANLSGWRQVEEGSEVELIIQESVVAARLRLNKFQKRTEEFFNDLQKRISGLFFMWACEHCQAKGYITYEDGEESQGIAERIGAAHKKVMVAGCDKTKLKIYDHRGIPQRDSALIMSFRETK